MSNDLPDWSSGVTQQYTVPTYIAEGHATVTGTSITASLSVAAEADDLILLWAVTTWLPSTITGWPAGSSLVKVGTRGALYAYGAAGGETAFTLTQTASYAWALAVLQFRNAALGPWAYVNAASTGVVVTPTKLPWMYVALQDTYAASGYGLIPPAPTGFVQAVGIQSGSTPGIGLGAAYALQGVLSSVSYTTYSSSELIDAIGLQV